MRSSWSSTSTSCNTTSTSEGGVPHNLELGLGTSTSTSSLFVKVYMEGHPIGRKLDILAHTGYRHLVSTLDRMFNSNILLDADNTNFHHDDFHVLTYEDDEGDWIMVGDVPWELFLGAVKRLKISRPCPCT